MCLAIPGKVLAEFEQGGMRMAKVQFGGIVREASLDYVPAPKLATTSWFMSALPSAPWTRKRLPALTSCWKKWIN